MEKQYYIVSLKHTSKGDTALTFWGANGGGYTWHRDRAGIYYESLVDHFTSAENVKVLKETVDLYWMNADDFDDKYISVPNNPMILKKFGLSAHLMKPKKFAGCRMVFTNLPVDKPVIMSADTPISMPDGHDGHNRMPQLIVSGSAYGNSKEKKHVPGWLQEELYAISKPMMEKFIASVEKGELTICRFFLQSTAKQIICAGYFHALPNPPEDKPSVPIATEIELRQANADLLAAVEKIKNLYDNVEDAAGVIAKKAVDAYNAQFPEK